MIDYENKTVNELMGMYNPIFEDREHCCSVDYNELFCDWLYGLINCIEASQPEPKYNVDDVVWRLNDEEGVTECHVLEIDLASDEMYLCTDDEFSVSEWTEEQLYPTREALIESQLWHWTRMMAEEMHGAPACCGPSSGECQHEPSRARKIVSAYKEDVTFFECKKCGKFYR